MTRPEALSQALEKLQIHTELFQHAYARVRNLQYVTQPELRKIFAEVDNVLFHAGIVVMLYDEIRGVKPR